MRWERFKRNGPRILGYEPGWLWWAAVLVIVSVSAWAVQSELSRHQRSRAYIDKRIAHYASEQGLDLALVRAVVQAESNFDWQAESSVGAKGLMQIMPIALEDVKRTEGISGGDLFDIDYNLRVGTLYLKYLLDRFDGDTTLAVAAYHMGPTAVSKGEKQHPGLSSRELVEKIGGPQTRAYVKQVMGLIEEE